MADQINYIYNKMHKTGLNSNIETLTFNTEGFSAQNPGQMSWNPDQGTLDIKLNSTAKLQIGEEIYYYGVSPSPKGLANNSNYANDDGNITNGQVVMLDGVDGAGRLYLRKAYYSEIDANPTLLLGVATTDIPSGQYGYVAWFGFVNDISTSQWQDQDTLYFSVSTPGGMTNIKPPYPNLAIPVATVTFLDTGIANGKIFVRPNNSYRLTDVVDLDLVTNPPEEGFVIKYTNGKWASASHPFDESQIGNSNNVPNTIVKRDASGNFVASDITATNFIGDLAGDLDAELINASGLATFEAGIAANGGSITTTAETFNLLQTNATTLNIGAASTNINIGGTTSGSTNSFANGIVSAGNVKTVNIGRNGAASSITNVNIGSSAGTSTINLYGTIKQPGIDPNCQVTKSNTIYTIWSGTQAQYDAISPKDTNTLYYIIG